MGFNSAFKGLNTELNPICHLVALLGTHHILHVSRVRVNINQRVAYPRSVVDVMAVVRRNGNIAMSCAFVRYTS